MSAEYERFDGLFTSIASGVNGIEPLMDAFFGFLGRKTDFYSSTDNTTENDIARQVTLQYFEKHRESSQRRRKVEQERNRKIDEERKRREEEKLSVFRQRQEELKTKPKVEEIFDDIDDVGKKETLLKNLSKKEEMKKDSQSSMEDEKSDDEHPPPLGNGGETDKYIWTQSLSTVDVLVAVAPGSTARQCKVTLTSTKLKVEVRGVVIIEGVLHDTIKASDSLWTLEDNQTIHLTLEKKEGMKWWSCVLKGDPEINTQKIVPENSKISDLDADLRQTVEKMMYDQEMKSKGLPTSSQSKQASVFESFKKSHPEMDFSNAKINWGGESSHFNNM